MVVPCTRLSFGFSLMAVFVSLLYLILLAFFIVDFDCSTRHDGDYSLGCIREFVTCTKGVLRRRLCAESLVFDGVLGRCIWPAECGRSASAPSHVLLPVPPAVAPEVHFHAPTVAPVVQPKVALPATVYHGKPVAPVIPPHFSGMLCFCALQHLC